MPEQTKRCIRCKQIVPADQAHEIKTTETTYGRAWRCDECGERENSDD
jgi:DNA-directed RNA polymerase subunit RPC12/RpoP